MKKLLTEILEAGGGVVANTYIMETMGKYFGTGDDFKLNQWQKFGEAISDPNRCKRPFQGGDVAMKHFETIQKSES
ncbi:MAG: hypothetical protein CM15mP127_14740 [Gammaproteobacteria bacterium]|nr:MAG: hypothetical protein CM15mP127_14740 [Gammaproteobacteria bacterium]